MEEYPVKFDVVHPEKSSRGVLLLRLFFGWLYVGIPHGICLAGLGVAAMFVQFIAWWAVLFTGKYPLGLFNFMVGFMRWQNRVMGYQSFLTDKYPPFSMK